MSVNVFDNSFVMGLGRKLRGEGKSVGIGFVAGVITGLLAWWPIYAIAKEKWSETHYGYYDSYTGAWVGDQWTSSGFEWAAFVFGFCFFTGIALELVMWLVRKLRREERALEHSYSSRHWEDYSSSSDADKQGVDSKRIAIVQGRHLRLGASWLAQITALGALWGVVTGAGVMFLTRYLTLAWGGTNGWHVGLWLGLAAWLTTFVWTRTWAHVAHERAYTKAH